MCMSLEWYYWMFLWTVSLFKMAACDCWISFSLHMSPEFSFCYVSLSGTVFVLNADRAPFVSDWNVAILHCRGCRTRLLDLEKVSASSYNSAFASPCYDHCCVGLSHCRLMFRRHLVWISVTLHTLEMLTFLFGISRLVSGWCLPICIGHLPNPNDWYML